MSATTLHQAQYRWVLAFPLLALALWAEWADFFALWYDSIIYAHGYLVLAGTLFLLFDRRALLRQLTVTGSSLALLLLAGASIALLLAQAADIRVVRLLLTPVVILLWGWSIWGWRFVRIAGGPVMLLLFAVPVWDDFSPLLQHITVFFNTLLLQLADIEARIEEFLIVLEVGAFLVEDGCSGVRYLMVALFLGSFYGQMYFRSFGSTALLVVTAGLLSMLANWIRVFGVIAAGHYTNMETSLVKDHELFGWVIFVIFTLAPLFYVATRLERAQGQSHTPQTGQAPAGTPAPPKWPWLWPALASVFVLWPALLPMALQAKTEQMAKTWSPTLMDPVSGWRGPLRHASVWEPEFSGHDIDLSGVYVSEKRQQVQLQITGYRHQRQEKELIFYRNRLYDNAEWQLVSDGERPLPDDFSLSPQAVNETVIESRQDQSRVIVWSWYDVGGFLTHSKIEAKLVGALKKISGDSRGALWALAGRCDAQNCDLQRVAFEQFLGKARR